jgi:hypothetical protein
VPIEGTAGRPGIGNTLSKVGGVELANLRSAVHRAAEVEKLAIETQSDEKNFYV